MSTFTESDVRAWGVANGYPKARTGKLGRAVIDAYLEAVHGATTGPEPVAEDVVEDEQYDYNVILDMPACPSHEGDIARALVDLVDVCFRAGQAAERARVLAALGVDE